MLSGALNYFQLFQRNSVQSFHFRFFIYWNGSCSSWIITLMSIERFLAIYFPIRTKTLTSTKKLIITITVTATALSGLNLHFFWTYKLMKSRYSKYCGSVSKYSEFLRDYWPWISLVFYSLIPFIILISTSTAIILKIVHSSLNCCHWSVLQKTAD